MPDLELWLDLAQVTNVVIDLYIFKTVPEFWLLFSDKPRFSKGLANVEVDEGQELTLSIQCSAVPEPKIKW
jgi:hypothetical protein